MQNILSKKTEFMAARYILRAEKHMIIKGGAFCDCVYYYNILRRIWNSQAMEKANFLSGRY